MCAPGVVVAGSHVPGSPDCAVGWKLVLFLRLGITVGGQTNGKQIIGTYLDKLILRQIPVE